MSKYTSIILIAVICACSSKQHPEGLSHPDPDQLPKAEEISYVLNMKNADHKLSSPRYDFGNYELSRTIGSADGADEYYLYDIKHMRMHDDGNLYITKGDINTIFVYDRDGSFSYSIGSSGNGPEEFTRMINFDFDSDYQHLYVLDQTKIEVFSLKDGRYVYEHTILHDLLFAHDLCALNNNIYVSGFHFEELDEDQHVERVLGGVTNSKPIHIYSRDSESRISSFGISYKSYSKNPIWGGTLSEMMLNCNSNTGTVTGLQKTFAHLYGFDEDGQLKWISRIDELDYEVLTESNIKTPRERMISSRNDALFSPRYRAFRDTGSEFSVLQINYAISAANMSNLGNLIRMQFTDRPVFHSIYIDTGTGELSLSEMEKEDSPEIFMASKDGQVITVKNDEFGSNNIQLIRIYNE